MDDLFIDYLINKMSLKEKIGQLLYIDYRKTNEKIIGMTNDFEKILNEYKPGGFILFNSNISDFNNTKKFIKDIQSINENNMFIGIDQEGGSVQRLGSNVGFKKIPAASLINDKEEAYLLGKEVGMELFSIGVNMNMAPVMDIWSNIKNIVMMNRTYGSDPYEVSDKALSFVRGLKEVKIIPVVKHFPGHGSTNVNSHIDLPISYKTKEELYNLANNNELLQVAEEEEKYDPFESNKGKFKTESGRNIYYYGEEFGEMPVVNKIYEGINTLNDLFGVLLKAWTKESAYPSAQKDPEYNKSNDPTYGQCAITATLVYDMFGGTIHKIKVNGGGTHYFNKINGHYIDLTRDQFDLYNIPVNYEPNETIDREYCGKNADTLKRFELLKENIEKVIK